MIAFFRADEMKVRSGQSGPQGPGSVLVFRPFKIRFVGFDANNVTSAALPIRIDKRAWNFIHLNADFMDFCRTPRNCAATSTVAGT
jgi:hypothetical protein